MAEVSVINLAPGDLMRAGSAVAEHLQVAATPPAGAAVAPAVGSPVDVAAAGAATAIHTKIGAMSAELTGKDAQLRAATTGGATALQAQDATNSTRLDDIGTNMSSGGGSGIQGGNYHPGQGRIIAVDNGTNGNNNGSQPPPAIKLPPHQNPPTVINMHAGENPQPDPGRHPCPAWEVGEDVAEGIGGPLAVAGSVIGGIAASPLGPAEWAAAISVGLLGIGATLHGFGDLSSCE